MTACCNSSSTRHTCPVNGKSYPSTPLKTLLHHLKNIWTYKLKTQTYYFCDDRHCEVVYFADDNSVFTQDTLRTTVGQKTDDADALLCYCFGISHQHYKDDPSVKQFVIEQTRLSNCACETRNPSGRCCLKDFPRLDDQQK